jgi:hypothetical protein
VCLAEGDNGGWVVASLFLVVFGSMGDRTIPTLEGIFP